MLTWTVLGRLSILCAMKSNGIAWALWFIFLAAVLANTYGNDRHSVIGNYRNAALAWLAGEPVYEGTGVGFIYFPTAAVLFVPLAILPVAIGEAVWRAVSIAMMSWGIWRLSGAVEANSNTPASADDGGRFLVITWLALPIVWSAARNGQMTLLMASTMMLATADLVKRRWSRASCWLSLGLAAKPLILAMTLLVAALYPRARWRIAAGALAVLLIPFLVATPSYAWRQYLECVISSREAAKLGVEFHWAQLFGLLRVFGADIPAPAQTVARVVAAIATLAACGLAQRVWAPARSAQFLFALASSYVMLFNPRTENNTYALLAPAIGFQFSEALAARDRWRAAGFAIVAAGILGSFEIGRLFVRREEAVWLAPLMTCWLATHLVRRLTGELSVTRPSSGASDRQPSSVSVPSSEHQVPARLDGWPQPRGESPPADASTAGRSPPDPTQRGRRHVA